MDYAIINWVDGVFTWEAASNLREELTGYYALLGATKSGDEWINLRLLYIGIAFKQSVATRLEQDHDSYPCIKSYLEANPKTTLVVMVGYLSDCSLEKVTEKFAKEVECCLIRNTTPQPLCNTQCKKTYNGRPMKVKNTGDYFPFKDICFCFPDAQ